MTSMKRAKPVMPFCSCSIMATNRFTGFKNTFIYSRKAAKLPASILPAKKNSPPARSTTRYSISVKKVVPPLNQAMAR